MQDDQPAGGFERRRQRPNHVLPRSFVCQCRFLSKGAACHRDGIGMHESTFDEAPCHEARPACAIEVSSRVAAPRPHVAQQGRSCTDRLKMGYAAGWCSVSATS